MLCYVAIGKCVLDRSYVFPNRAKLTKFFPQFTSDGIVHSLAGPHRPTRKKGIAGTLTARDQNAIVRTNDSASDDVDVVFCHWLNV